MGIGEIYPQCNYECDNQTTSVTRDSNPACYTSYYYYIQKLGGYPGVVGIAITLMFVLVIIAFRFFRKKRKFRFKDSMEKNSDAKNFEEVISEKGQLHT